MNVNDEFSPISSVLCPPPWALSELRNVLLENYSQTAQDKIIYCVNPDPHDFKAQEITLIERLKLSFGNKFLVSNSGDISSVALAFSKAAVIVAPNRSTHTSLLHCRPGTRAVSYFLAVLAFRIHTQIFHVF